MIRETIIRNGAAVLGAALLLSLAANAIMAQELRVQGEPERRSERAETAPSQDNPGMFGRIGDWFDRQFNTMQRDLKSAKENFDRDTDRAGKKTLETAKDAADAVARLPDQRTVRGRESCLVAPNGAPDCESAATKLCRSKGYGAGKSIDSTTAETCPPQVMLSGRTGAPGECKLETFISRAVCSP